MYMRDGAIVTGAIANAPPVFYAIGVGGDLVTLGMFVLSRHAQGAPDTAPFIGKIEDLVTYDVLPNRRAAPAQSSERGDRGTGEVTSRNFSGWDDSRAGAMTTRSATSLRSGASNRCHAAWLRMRVPALLAAMLAPARLPGESWMALANARFASGIGDTISTKSDTPASGSGAGPEESPTVPIAGAYALTGRWESEPINCEACRTAAS